MPSSSTPKRSSRRSTPPVYGMVSKDDPDVQLQDVDPQTVARPSALASLPTAAGETIELKRQHALRVKELSSDKARLETQVASYAAQVADLHDKLRQARVEIDSSQKDLVRARRLGQQHLEESLQSKRALKNAEKIHGDAIKEANNRAAFWKQRATQAHVCKL